MLKVSDIQEHFSLIDWKKFFSLVTNHDIQNDSLVQVYFRDEFVQIFKKLKRIEEAYVSNKMRYD